MIIYTAVYGVKYIEYFEKGLLMSFRWPLNLQELSHNERTWIINCHAHEQDYLFGLVKNVCKIIFINMDSNLGLLYSIEYAHGHNKIFLMAPPDTIFSDGSLTSFIKIAAQHNVCVASAHVRVLPSFLADVENYSHPTPIVATFFLICGPGDD
jgi:hypothetical protein